MEINILEITERITINSGVSVLDWPSLVRWMKTQLPLRKVTGYCDYCDRNKLCGWKDAWQEEVLDVSFPKAFDDAVLSTEIVGFLKSAPISLSTKESIEVRDYLIGMGLLVAHFFTSSVKAHSLIQFRI